jgi:serine/threonine-protein kinase
MSATATAILTTREGFLEALRKSNVLSESQYRKAIEELGGRGRTPRRAAERLVNAGYLSRFQSERILTGRTDGFFIGPYLVLDYIGKSETGRVYKARHTTMNRHVAIKVVSSHLCRSEPVRQAVREEARHAAALAHPNIVTLLDANQAGERMYFVREYVEGPTLDEIVRGHGTLPVNLACEYVRQAAVGLQHAHERGIVHGKLAPRAILVAPPAKPGDAPLVKVSGFGLGKFAGDSAETNFDFTAPESFAEPPNPDPRSDLYALGCILYVLLTGRPPFATTDAGNAREQHQGSVPPALDRLRPDLPHALIELIYGLLAKQPSQRPGSAAEVAFRIAPFAEGDPGMIDFGLTLPPSSSNSGSLTNLARIAEAIQEPMLPQRADEASTSWGSIVTPETLDGVQPVDATPLGVKPRAKGAVNPIALALIVGGVILGVLLALLAVLKRFA